MPQDERAPNEQQQERSIGQSFQSPAYDAEPCQGDPLQAQEHGGVLDEL